MKTYQRFERNNPAPAGRGGLRTRLVQRIQRVYAFLAGAKFIWRRSDTHATTAALLFAYCAFVAVPANSQTGTIEGTTTGNQGSGSGSASATVTANVLNENGSRTITFSWTVSKTSGNNEVGIAIRTFDQNGTMTGNTTAAVANGLAAVSDSGTSNFTTPVPGSGYSTIRLFCTQSINDGVVVYMNPTIIQFDPTAVEHKYRVAGTNTTARPIRLVLRAGTEIVGQLDVQPGAVYDQTFTVTLEQKNAGLKLETYAQDTFGDGVWLQNSTMNLSTATKVGEADVAAVTLPAGGIPDASYQAYSNRGPSTAAPTASTSTTGVWTSTNATRPTTDDERLDKATYREGVDKLERAISREEKLKTAKEDYEAAEYDLLTGATTWRDTIVAQIPVPTEGTAVVDTSVEDINVATYSHDNISRIGLNSLNFTIGALWPNWKTYANWMREAFLIGMAIQFCFLVQARFERYYRTMWLIPERTTKPEFTQIFAPGVGWGKQAATALTFTAVFALAIAAAVVFMNTQIGALLEGGSAVNAISLAGAQASALFGQMGLAYDLVNAFIPVPAIFELCCCVRHYRSWAIFG